MKKYLFLVATLLLTVSMTMSAQKRDANNRRSGMDNRRSEYIMRMTPQERVSLMTKELDLTAKEAADVLAMCEKQEAERVAQVAENRSKRGTGKANRDDRREEFREMRAEKMKQNQEELAKIIGKERADKWYELRQDVRNDNRAGRMDGGRGYYRDNQRNIDGKNYDNRRSDYMMRMSPQERVDLMTKELDLTPEQATQVLALTTKQEAERKAQVEEQRSNRGTGTVDRDARREEFRALRDKQMKEHQEELVKIIGKEKADKWNDLRQDVKDDNRAGRRNPRNSNR